MSIVEKPAIGEEAPVLELSTGDNGKRTRIILFIEDKKTGPVLQINADGTVFWRKDGKFVEAKVDKDLSAAFGIALVYIVKGFLSGALNPQ